MKEDAQSLMAALSVNLLTVNMLLSVFFLPGGSDGCDGRPPVLFIKTPGKIEALSGSCLKIPCSFTTEDKTFDRTRTIYGVWMKNRTNFLKYPDFVIFNSSKSVNSYPVKVTGNLNQNDCTSEFPGLNTSHTDRYFFRIETKPFKATACSTPLQITIKDSPWSPTINISAGLKDLKEKESVTISCSALTPCPHSPPELTWNLQQDSHTQTEKKTDGTLTTKIQENITLSDTHDGNIITCSVRYPVNEGKQFKTAETNVTLSVSYAPKDTSASISPSGLVSAGSWVNLSCSSRAKPPVSSFTWFKISSEGPVQVSEEQVYRLQITSSTDPDSYFCVASNNIGSQTSSWNHLKKEGCCQLLSPLIAVIVVLVLVCLIVSVCSLMSSSRFKFRRQTPPQTQNETYEDMNFFRRKPEASSVSEEVRGGEQEEEEVIQVNVSETESSTLTADTAESLYSELKTK